MIFPQQTVLPFDFTQKDIDTLTVGDKYLGPLNIGICPGLDYTSKYQLPKVKPLVIDIPEDIQAFYRIKDVNLTRTVFAHFYTNDDKYEKIWRSPYSYVNCFRKFSGIISTDYSIQSNMLEMQRLWNDFRNKLLAAFFQKWGVTVVASPSWSNDMCNIERYMDGWPHNSIIAINSTGVCHDKRSRHIWLDGYNALLDILHPSHILRYGGYIEGEDREISTYYINNNKHK